MLRRSLCFLFTLPVDPVLPKETYARPSGTPGDRGGRKRIFDAAELRHGRAAEQLHEAHLHQRSSGPRSNERPIADPYNIGKKPSLFSAINGYEKAQGAADYLSPVHRRVVVTGGLDQGTLRPERLSVEERRRRMREALEENSESFVAVADDEEGAALAERVGEQRPLVGGSPGIDCESDKGFTISGQGTLHDTIFSRGVLKSRAFANSWSVLERPDEEERQRELRDASLHDRQWNGDEGSYHRDFDDPVLEHAYEAVNHTTSTYTHTKLYMAGLYGVERFLSQHEEKSLAEELLSLTQRPSATYIAEEARYCVNLYETSVGLPGRDPIALSLNNDAPLLLSILKRAFDVGLIPAMPNIAQVCEFVGSYSGYPMHRKHSSIGAYYGLLSLISPTVMHMAHTSQPWSPKLYLRPRSLFVIQEPCLSEYSFGYRKPHQPFHSFRFATRQSKDYRLEVLFATIDVKQTPLLSEAVMMTQYAAGGGRRRLLEGGAPVPATDAAEHPGATADTSEDKLVGQAASMQQVVLSALAQSSPSHSEGRRLARGAIDGHALAAATRRAGLMGRGKDFLPDSPADEESSTADSSREGDDDDNNSINKHLNKPSVALSNSDTARARLQRLKERIIKNNEISKDRDKRIQTDSLSMIRGKYKNRIITY